MIKNYFENKSQEFLDSNKKTIEICNQIEGYFTKLGLIFTFVVINCLSLSLKLNKDFRQRNNTIIVLRKGYSKSTFIEALVKDNLKFFNKLDDKSFESELVGKGDGFFDGKISYLGDLITSFTGVTKKQKEQFLSFWTQLLNGGKYSRNKDKLNVKKTMALFGIAENNYSKHRSDLLDSTFLDRFIVISKKVTKEEVQEILKHRNFLRENNILLPKLKLPFSNKEREISIKLNKENMEKINMLAQELEDCGALSATRAQDMILVFIMSNALFNDRKESNEYDLELYKMMHTFVVEAAKDIKLENKVKFLFKGGKSVKEICKELNKDDSYIYKIIKDLKDRGDI